MQKENETKKSQITYSPKWKTFSEQRLGLKDLRLAKLGNMLRGFKLQMNAKYTVHGHGKKIKQGLVALSPQEMRNIHKIFPSRRTGCHLKERLLEIAVKLSRTQTLKVKERGLHPRGTDPEVQVLEQSSNHIARVRVTP